MFSGDIERDQWHEIDSVKSLAGAVLEKHSTSGVF